MAASLPDIDDFRCEARRWLAANAMPKPATTDGDGDLQWGVGSDNVAVFLDLPEEMERARLEATRAWQQRKFDAGYAMISWPEADGGRGLPGNYTHAYNNEEAEFDLPSAGELPPTSIRLIAPTIATHGTPKQKKRFITPLLRMDELACQLFSEPSAGSDLASLRTRAERDGDEWLINGQKVWTSGARFADWGLLITRTNPTVPKHRGLTAFLLPLAAPGVEVRPIRQMSGGANFNAVFMTDVRLSDELRLGDIGDGWRVALTCLDVERDHSSGSGSREVGGGVDRVIRTAQYLGCSDDAVIRQTLSDLFIHERITQLTNGRVAAALKAGQMPGPAGSLGKLMWTANMARVSRAIGAILGPRLVADTGEWGTFAWGEHVLGAPGYRIAGGSDEIQRNIVGERVLGLPPEPRLDKDIPFNEVPH